MTLNPVPLAVEGAAHSVRVMRRFANIATRDAEGVALPTHCKVRPLDVSGAGVQIADGGLVIRNRLRVGGGESYIGSNEGPHIVPVAATGSSARTDLIIVRVKDPNEDGSVGAPADPLSGPYLVAEVISGVPASTTRVQDIAQYASLAAVTLARITQPAGSGAVTAAMITDLRKLWQSRSEVVIENTPLAGAQLTSGTEVQWITTTQDVDIPEWSTHLDGSLTLSGLILRGGAQTSAHRLRIGTSLYSAGSTIDTGADVDTQRMDAKIGMNAEIPAALRGTRQTVRLLSRRASGTARLDAAFGVRGEWLFAFKERLA